MRIITAGLAGLLTVLLPGRPAPRETYPWLPAGHTGASLAERVPPPPGYTRVTAAPGTFAHWLRHLPLKPPNSPVLLFNGRLKDNQAVHCAVVAMDTGSRNLQQCADAVLRLRAEYLYSRGRLGEIEFRFTSGDRFPFPRWVGGERPAVRGNRVTWRHRCAPDASHASLRRYLDVLFTYAGSVSLVRDTVPRPGREMRIGDIFVQGGFPGHAVLVVDLARRRDSGDRVFLLVQSYMPAQEVHLLKNPTDPTLSPWYAVPDTGILVTPEWTFRLSDLRAFPRWFPSGSP